MDDGTKQGLEDAIIAVLRPAGLRQRLRGRLGRGGHTVKEILVRLPTSARGAISGERDDELGVAGERRALDALREVLLDMARRGRLRRRRVRGQYFLNTKGNRLVEVDLFALPSSDQ